MMDLPVMLRVQGKRCVVVGGGGTACRRARSLLQAGARVRLVAPSLEKDFDSTRIEWCQRKYQAEDVKDAFLVVIATDDTLVNEQVQRDAQSVGALINRVDDPTAGDLTIPAHESHGPVTLAVHTSGISAAAAAAIRRELSAALDPDWLVLLEVAAPFRAKIQQLCPDARQRQIHLRKLTDSHAMSLLKKHGKEALLEYLQGMMEKPILEKDSDSNRAVEP